MEKRMHSAGDQVWQKLATADITWNNFKHSDIYMELWASELCFWSTVSIESLHTHVKITGFYDMGGDQDKSGQIFFHF